ncbi:MAG: peptidoglycan-binding protein [Acidobacteria bacterium]|nr:peptidoglycan-binding protein [Acidobacteriota bacterium]
MGNLKFLDYFDKPPGQKGFNSLADMGAAYNWGPNFATGLKLIPSTKVLELTNLPIRAMQVTDKFVLATPIIVGARWTEGATDVDRVHNMLRSAWQFMSNYKKQSLVPPPLPSPNTLNNLQKISVDSPSINGLGFSNRSPVGDAAGAPRIDWLTGVQYRLRFLNYYSGDIHGNNDEATKSAVLKFQKEWFKEKQEWDSIPGPHTQARLKLIVGW